MSERLKLVVIDRHTMFRRSIVSTLEEHDDMELVGETGSVDEAVGLATELLPDIVLLDAGSPAEGRFSVVEDIVQRCPTIKVVILTISASEDFVSEVFRAGASAYIVKGISGPDFISALRSLQSGRVDVPQHCLTTSFGLRSHRKY